MLIQGIPRLADLTSSIGDELLNTGNYIQDYPKNGNLPTTYSCGY